jgi:subtilase family serine protease
VIKYYLSTDSSYDAGDTCLGERAISSSLAAGATSPSGSTPLTIPSTVIRAGTYYIIAIADARNNVTEVSETNNGKSSGIIIGPDLTASSFSAPASANAGSTITVSDTVKNSGAAPSNAASAGTSTTKFYLSANSSYESWDIYLNSRSVSSLEAGATNSSGSGGTSLTIPAGMPAGIYYLLSVADANGDVLEFDESNNVRISSLIIGPDLTVSSLYAPASANLCSYITVTDITKNSGSAPTGTSITRFYLSENTTFELGTDPCLGERVVPPIAAGDVSYGSTSVQIIGNFPRIGTVYLIDIANADGNTSEASYTNNSRVRAISIGYP